MACKWTFRGNVKIQGNDTLAKLMQFYLWTTPVPGISQKGKEFSRYGWEGSNYPTLHSRMRRLSGFPDAKGTYWIDASASKINDSLKQLHRYDDYNCSFEFAVHTVKHGLNKTEALFYLIRNSFAHGGFRISKYEGERYYVFENRQGDVLKGRAIFKEQTLLGWIKIVKIGPK